MEKEYSTKDMKPVETKEAPKKELPIYEKRGRWCFKKKGGLYKFATKEEAEKKWETV
jgi:hypothetical protein